MQVIEPVRIRPAFQKVIAGAFGRGNFVQNADLSTWHLALIVWKSISGPE